MRTILLACCSSLLVWSVLNGPSSLAQRADGSRGSPAIHVPAGDGLQQALDAAPEGAEVTLEPGATFTGSVVLRRGVTLRTAGTLPEGRVSREWSGRLALVRSTDTRPAIRIAPGVEDVRLVGIEVTGGHPNGTAIEVGSGSEANAARQPRDVLIDRVLVLGNAVEGLKRGIALHGSDITVTRSYVADIKRRGQDTQAIWINNGTGPFAITDNYVEASGENIMVGGDTPGIDKLVPADIRIEGNTIAKPLAWKDERWTIKNLVELKSGRRVVIRGNVLEGSWVSGQVGYGILLTPKDQYGRAPWTTVSEVIVEANVIREVAEGIRVLGDDHKYPVERTEGITITRNLIVASRHAHGGTGRCLTVGRAPQQIEFSSNTCIVDGAAAIYTYAGGDVRQSAGAVFRDNVYPHNRYGFSAEGQTAGGMAALKAYYPDGALEENLIGGGSASRYPGNTVLAVEEWRAQFADFDGGDYRVRADSPFAGKGWQP